MKQRTLLLRRCLRQLKLLKEKVGQVKDYVASTLGTSNEKPHKDDEARKNEAQYDAAQEEYDSLELCSKRLVKLLKMLKRKLEKQKRVLVQLQMKQNRRLLRLYKLPRRR
jgi:hypothetical protein